MHSLQTPTSLITKSIDEPCQYRMCEIPQDMYNALVSLLNNSTSNSSLAPLDWGQATSYFIGGSVIFLSFFALGKGISEVLKLIKYG